MKLLAFATTWVAIINFANADIPIGIYGFENHKQLSVAEIEGHSVVIFEGQIRGLRPVTPNTFEYGNALGAFDRIEGHLIFSDNECVWETNGVRQQGVRIPLLEKPISFKNEKTNLSGLLILPAGEGPFPSIVFTHGSGPETREASRALAYLVAANGIAALIYDKRGTGASSGKEWQDSFENYAGDAIAAAEFLTKQPSIDSKRIGIYGHSQGGWIVPIALSKSGAFSFGIISAANAVSPVQQTLDAGDEECRLLGMDEVSISKLHAFRKIKYEVAAGIKDVREYKENFLPAAEKESWFKLTGAQLPEGPFWKKNGFYDPAHALQSIRCPLLVIYAEFDISTNTSNNLPLMKSLLQTPEVKYAVYKANHWMMEVNSKGFIKKQLPFITRFADGYPETLVQWTQSAAAK